MPGMQAAVVSCFDHGADVVMEPTSSALVAKRKLPLLQKSFMGNLGKKTIMKTSLSIHHHHHHHHHQKKQKLTLSL